MDTAEVYSHQFVDSIYARFDAALRGFFRNKLRNEADAQDLTQEVYLRFVGLKNPSKIRSEKAFIFTTATNLLRDRSRRLITQLDNASCSIEDVTLECRSSDPALRLLDTERVRALAGALNTVSEKTRHAFWLSRIEGKSYAEIAEEMGISNSMVEKHISSALRALARVEQGQGS